jgi:hypothetical protein
MATPEEIYSQPDQKSELHLIPGGLAVEQTVKIERTLPESIEIFMAALNEESWAGMSAEQLMQIREIISAQRGKLASLIHSLQQDHDALLHKQIWINGYIRDRQ